MRCHYEILGVSRDADDAEIKSAYKKLALKWHPDKNLDNPVNAKEQFQLVQQAYEVLSDKQERAWYDRHREQILRGANSDLADKELDVFQYFTTSCFTGYGDDEKGFYTIYRGVFEQIAKEDIDYCEKEAFCNIPSFGTSTSDYESIVHPFYSYWMSYVTKKSYVWLDPYDIKDVKDRRLFKAVEKENKKVRLKAKKERNEEIRNLVSFVRKRDIRVKNWIKLNEAKIEKNREKQELIRKQKLQEQRKQNESEVQAEWMKFDNVKVGLQEIEKSLTEQFGNTDDESDLEENSLYCAACNKLFRTTKSFQNHESSRKHKENVDALRMQMLADDADYKTENNFDATMSIDPNCFSEEEHETDLSDTNNTTKKTKKNRKNRKILEVEDDDEELPKLSTLLGSESSDDDQQDVKKTKRKTRRAKTKKVVQCETTTVAQVTDDETKDQSLSCVTCNKTFPSKNKLFQHLDKEGHHKIPVIIKKGGKKIKKI